MFAGCPPTGVRERLAACAPVGGPVSSSGEPEARAAVAEPVPDGAASAVIATADAVIAIDREVRNPSMAMA
jgi:hypothetical protein